MPSEGCIAVEAVTVTSLLPVRIRAEPNAQRGPLGGVYANLVNVWHTGFEFTLEFAVSLPSGPEQIEATQVARLKLPPQIAWRLAQIISHHVAAYEETCGAFTPAPPMRRTQHEIQLCERRSSLDRLVRFSVVIGTYERRARGDASSGRKLRRRVVHKDLLKFLWLRPNGNT